MLHARRRIRPAPLDKGSPELVELIETYFNAYNAARLREACQTFARMIDAGATIGVSISGALTPAGLSSVLVPLIRRGELYGVVYVGNDSVTSLFTQRELTLMSSFCSTARQIAMWRASSLPTQRNASLSTGMVERWYMPWNKVAAAISPIRNEVNRIASG